MVVCDNLKTFDVIMKQINEQSNIYDEHIRKNSMSFSSSTDLKSSMWICIIGLPIILILILILIFKILKK